jgi:CRP/FNR family transcriptional regulator
MAKPNTLFDCNTCIFKVLTCRFMPEDDFEVIRRTSNQMKFQKGETIYKQGAKSGSLIFLHKGIIKFTFQTEDGRNFITTIVKGPKLLGAANLFFKETNIFSVIALEDSNVCFIDNRALRNVAVKHGNYILAMCEQTLNMFQSSIFNFISLAHKHVYGRIADILIYLWEHVYMDGEYEFNLTRKEISEFAACSHENVITTLSKLNKENVIGLEGKKILIKDLKKLYEISKNG